MAVPQNSYGRLPKTQWETRVLGRLGTWLKLLSDSTIRRVQRKALCRLLLQFFGSE